MASLPLLTFLRGAGGCWVEVAHLTENNVALQKVFFSYSRNGFELSFYFKDSYVVLSLINWNLFSCSDCLCLLAFFKKYVSVVSVFCFETF